jgi:hypothetical protein
MPGDKVRDRAVLAVLFLVGGSSTLWGLYEVYYVSPTSPSGLFNTVLGLLVLLVTWAYLVPYVVPRRAALSVPPEVASTRAPTASRARAAATGRPAPAPLSRATRTRPTAAPPGRLPTAPARPVPPAAVSAPVRRVGTSATAQGPTPSARKIHEEEEIAEILADLPEPLDPALMAESPDDVVRRLDALLRDLSVDQPSRGAAG